MPSTPDIANLSWPLANLGDALTHLSPPAQPTAELVLPSPLSAQTDADLNHWLHQTAAIINLEIEQLQVAYSRVDDLLQAKGDSILRLLDNRFLILRGPHWRGGIRLLLPNLTETRISVSQLRQIWCAPTETAILQPLRPLLDKLQLDDTHQQLAHRTLAKSTLGHTPITGCWRIDPTPSPSLWQQLRREKLLRPSVALLAANLTQQLMQVGAWYVIGRGALEGRFDLAWLIAWGLLLYTEVLFQTITFTVQAPFVVGMMRFLRERILDGALQLNTEEVRTQGSGQFFGRVLESDMLQAFLIGGTLLALPFVLILIITGAVLSLGVGGWVHVALLTAWVSIAFYIGWRRLRHGNAGMFVYRNMTNDLVERMLGHRTRLAQEDRQQWHADEDHSLAYYMSLSRLFDWSGVWLDVLIPRGWLLLGLLGIAYPFVWGDVVATQQRLAISLGGILLGYQAFESLAQSMKFVAQATMSWRQVSPLLSAASRPRQNQAMSTMLPTGTADPGHDQPIIMMRDVVFRYTSRGQAILNKTNLTINKGDRFLLEGPSGGGKSTLAAVLAGLREPESGLLLLWGFDQQTVGTNLWRQRIVAAPQFQENHLFNDTFAFNLLMGRNWPPTPSDLEEAEAVCRELGLGRVLDQMPHGLHQHVGQGGWQLSQGERSRLYIARALLQQADVVILDESFGALDPENLRVAMQCVLGRAPTLLVIAHP